MSKNDSGILNMANLRIDFEFIEIKENSDGSHIVYATPNSERYELKEINGEKGYWDKFDKFFIPLTVCDEIGKKMMGCPILSPMPKIENLEEYFNERYSMLHKYFDDTIEYDSPTSESVLAQFEESDNFFNFISVDMVESTKRSRILDSKLNSQVNRLFLNEISNIIRQYGGNIFKYEGDGLLAFYTYDNFLNKVDNSFESVIAIKLFINNYLNKYLENVGIPKINFRIGVNFGSSYVANFGEKTELYGHDFDITCKIQEFAAENQIIVGMGSVKLAHTEWRKRLKRIKINKRKLKQMGLEEDMELYELK